MNEFDVAIIGAGSGGLTAAFTAKGFGKKVVLIDKNNPGGECTWSGCVPSKSLINIAKDIHTAKKYNKDFDIDTSEILNNVRDVIQNVYKEENPYMLEKAGIQFISGFAKFIDKNTLDVNGEKIFAKKIIISTGSSPLIPPITGIDKINYFTNQNIFTLDKFPKSIIVLGGGAIGVELSQALNRIGVKVSLVEMMDTILFREEESLSKILQSRLVEEGVNINTSTKALEVKEINNKIILTVQKGNNKFDLEADGILLALGRVPNTNNMGLEIAGIEFDRKGIKTNKYLKTTAKGVYAIGDVACPYQFSHMANVQGILAVQNALLPINKKIDYSNVAWCTFSDPEFSRAGLTEKEAIELFKDKVRVYTHSYENLDRAKTKKNSLGIVKIICDKKGKIIGASILGDRAGEIICEIQTVKTLGINMGALTKVIHPYPTYSEVLLKISKKVYVDNILNNPFIKFINSFRK